jgi:hypothetical protein
MHRRQFLIGAGSLAIAARPLFAATQTPARSTILPASVRNDFPAVLKETYLNSASMHPVGTFAAEAAKKVIDYRVYGAGGGGADFNARAP